MPSDQAIDSARFREVLGCLPTGVTIVTAATDDGPVGMTVGSCSSVSLDPPLVLFCVGKNSSSWQLMRGAGHFAISILGADHSELSNQFASRDSDRFQGVDTTTAATGAPILTDALAWIDCSSYAVHDAGDHEIVVGLVEELAGGTGDDLPLVFFRSRYGTFQPV